VTRSFWLDQFGDGAAPLMKCSSCLIRAPADTYQSSELRFRARVGEISVGLFQRAERPDGNGEASAVSRLRYQPIVLFVRWNFRKNPIFTSKGSCVKTSSRDATRFRH